PVLASVGRRAVGAAGGSPTVVCAAGGGLPAFDAGRAAAPGSDLVVTTARAPSPDIEAQAAEVSARLGARLVVRGRRPLLDVLAESRSGLAYLVGGANWKERAEVRHEICDGRGGRVFVNPRMWRIIPDVMRQPLIQAVAPAGEPPPGDVVDATAGLGGTSLRIAHACGARCRLTACEISAPLACLLDFGLRRLAAQGEEWSEPASRVRAVHADALELLSARALAPPADRPDVVYLNPCMDLGSASAEDAFLHRVASLRPIAQDVFEAAVACARRRVVLRHQRGLPPPFGLRDGAPATRVVRGGQSDFLVLEV
ncbi:unnamed protein product, partial [Prorocentrum cordatum]